MSTTSATLKKETSAVSLMDSFGAVHAALSAMPDSAFQSASTSMADAFMLTDPVLMSLDKQRADANGQYIKLVRTYGTHDAMVDAMSIQRAAIEDAYNIRLAALRRRRSESSGRNTRLADDCEDELLQGKNTRKATQDRLRIQREEERLSLAREQERREQKKKDDAWWLWVLLLLSTLRHVDYQQRPVFGLV